MMHEKMRSSELQALVNCKFAHINSREPITKNASC